MFFKPKIYDHHGEQIGISRECRLSGDLPEKTDFMDSLLASCIEKSNPNGLLSTSVVFCNGFPQSIRRVIRRETELSDSNEAFAIGIDQTVKIYACSEIGFAYALTTLTQLLDMGELYRGFLYDYPLCDTRGYRTFLPARAGFDAFFKMVDFLVEYRYNAIILEVGGAMEYKRHPEINERWAEFAKETKLYSGRTHEIQMKTYPWPKNSIHTDNAEGDILTQEECRTLVAYCRSRGLEVIPECPTFSHSDYIVMAHPEIREREGDAHPDTYCPNHPDTYTYVFDVLEEVIDVFQPKIVNIGHDEMYSIGVCPRCKGTPAPVLYANDIKKIRDFLFQKDIRTMMWGEKLLNSFAQDGERIGGSGHGKGLARVPALFPCRDLIPRDVIMLHWYYVFNHQYDRVYHDRGFTTLYGNLNAMNVKHWDLRRSWGIRGGFVSNWGSFDEEYMQRNMQYFSLITTAYAFWCEDYESMGHSARLDMTMKEAYRLKRSKVKNPITIRHTTTHKIPYKCFYDGIFIEESIYALGDYVLTYTDKTTATLPVKYGTHIGCHLYDDHLHQAGFRELSYTTLPIRHRDGWIYECVYENPNPEKKIAGIIYRPREGKEEIAVELLSFTLPLTKGKLANGKTHLAGEEFAWDGDVL